MKHVQQIVEQKQQEFAKHPFFKLLQGATSLEQAMRFAPRLTFWVMAFQDVLRLNESLVRDPELKRIVLRHRDEDSGHDAWFLHDIRRLGGATPDASALFNKENAAVRDATYALVAEALRASDERLRVVLLLTLEAAGHIFFERISQFVDTHGYSNQLKYFSLHHLDVEKDHDLFDDQTEDEMLQITLPENLQREAANMIDRSFAAFGAMFDGLVETLPVETSVAVAAGGPPRQVANRLV